MDKKPLKILIVSYDWRNIFETKFKELEEKLKRDCLAPDFNHLFLVAWSSKSYYRQVGNVQTVHLATWLTRFRLVYDFLSIFLVPLILWRKKFKPDIMLVRDFPMVPAGLLVKLFWKTKIVFFLGSMPTNLAKTRSWPFFRWLYQRSGEVIARASVDVFLANGAVTRDYLVQMGVPQPEVKIMIEDVIDRDRELIGAAQGGEVRRCHRIDDSTKILLSIGRLEAEKGFPRLLHAISKIPRQDFVLLVVGEGVLKSELLELSARLGLAKRVIFAGFAGRDQIWNYYKAADAFILLSYSEGSPTVFREALFMGVPVIGSRIAPIEEFIGHEGERGFTWEEDEGVERLAEILDQCFDRSPAVREMLMRAGKFIEQNVRQRLVINDLLI